jgi:hypothetical protein
MGPARAGTCVALDGRVKRIGFLALLALLLACGMRNVERVPAQEADTERPSTIMSKDQLHSHMQAMAAHASRIDELLRAETMTASQQAEVVTEIKAISAIAHSLSVDDARTVHPVLWRNVDKFRNDVDLAARQAQADPPNFFLAGTVAGSCAYCHGTGLGKVH